MTHPAVHSEAITADIFSIWESIVTLLLLNVNQKTKRKGTRNLETRLYVLPSGLRISNWPHTQAGWSPAAPVIWIPFNWMPQSLMMAGVFSQNVSKDYPILSDPRGHPVKRGNRNIHSKGIRMTGASSQKGQLEHPCTVEWSIQSKGTTRTSSRGWLEHPVERDNRNIQSKGIQTTGASSPKGQPEHQVQRYNWNIHSKGTIWEDAVKMLVIIIVLILSYYQRIFLPFKCRSQLGSHWKLVIHTKMRC